MTTTITVDGLTVEYTASYPYVTLSVSFRVPDSVPFIGGKSYSLGRVSLALHQTEIELPIHEGPLSGNLVFTLNPAQCSFAIRGVVTLGPLRWVIGPTFAVYMTPFRLKEPSWSANPVILDPAIVQAKVNSATAANAGSRTGAPLLRNDAATQQELRSLFAFCGAGDFVDQMTATARHLGEVVRAKKLESKTGTADAADTFDPNMLVAFAINLEAGAGFGLSGAYGVYFTTQDGDFGCFGSYSIDAGLIASLAAGLVGFCYWSEGGNDAKGNFGGLNLFATIEGGEGLTVGFTVYWPEDSPLHVTDWQPCGVGFSVGAGLGFPVNFFVGNSNTIINIKPPPMQS